MHPNKYIIQTDSNSYFKGHGKRGAVFTNNPEEAVIFDSGEDAGQLAYLMNYTLNDASGAFSEIRLDNAVNLQKGVR